MGSVAIKNCPQCGSSSIDYDGIKKYHCPNCSWHFYQNTAAAVAGIIEHENKVFVVERNCDPGKGKFDFPGGFIDPMETAENALKREIGEELGVELVDLTYLCTAPNLYLYRGIEYTTCDIFYTARFSSLDFKVDESEIASYHWLNRSDLIPENFAFRSMKDAIAVYLSKY